MTFTKFQDVGPDRLDEVIGSLTDDEWDRLEQGFIDVANQHILDYFTEPLGLPESVDGTALFCRLYSLSLARTQGA